MHRTKSRSLILDPNDFYILASKERVRIPHAFAAEMVPYDPSVGEFRVLTSSFSVEQGFTQGAQVSVSLKSGTNTLHGGLADYGIWSTALRREQSPTRANLQTVDHFKLPTGQQSAQVLLFG